MGPRFYHLTLQDAGTILRALPGQFVMLRAGRGTDPLLRRPLGVHSVKGRTFSCLYEVVGPGTAWLSGLSKGDTVSVLGPLGSGFAYAKTGPQDVLVAGGMGVAPLLFLAQRLRKEGSEPLVLIGGRTKSHILCEKEFAAAKCRVRIATDDGSRGYRGYVSGLLEKELSRLAHPCRVFSCGPHPMLKAVAQVCAARNVPAQVSLEAHMACGIGACLGCVVETDSGLQRVCHEGPVFEASRLKW